MRLFEDGDFAFAHNEYDFSSLRAAFEVFRFEDGKAVEHWDNIESLKGPNPSGCGMLDGSTEITDLDRTNLNWELARRFAKEVLVEGQIELLDTYVVHDLIQHNPDLSDGVDAFRSTLTMTYCSFQIPMICSSENPDRRIVCFFIEQTD